VAAWGGFDLLRTDLTRADVIAKVSAWTATSPSSVTVDAWERAYRIEDGLKSFVSSSSARRASATLTAVWTAYYDVHAPAWVRMSLEERCRRAYDSFITMPQAGLARAREVDGTSSGTSSAFSEALYQGKHETVLGALLLEWLNRLEAVRLASEYALRGAAFTAPRPLAVGLLPPNFRGAVRALRRRGRLAPHLPLVLESFVFKWGGFRLPGAGEEALIGSELGVSASTVSDCLNILSRLFPPVAAPDWMRAVGGAEWLLLVRYPVQGLGVIHRDAVRPGWDAALAGTLSRRLREREAATRALLT
jgi:hypothetical protein